MKKNIFVKTVFCGAVFAFCATGIFAQSITEPDAKKIIKLEISDDGWFDEPEYFDWYSDDYNHVEEKNHPEKHIKPEGPEKPGEFKKPGEPGKPEKFRKMFNFDIVEGKIKIEGKKHKEIVYIETRDGNRYVITDFNFGSPHDDRKAEKKHGPEMGRRCSIHDIKKYKGKYIRLRGILNRGSNVFTVLGIEPERKPASGWEK